MGRTALLTGPWLLAAVAVAFACGVSAGPLERDEDVVLFNTSAYLDTDGHTWQIPIHGWVFELKEDSLWRRAVIGELLQSLEVDGESEVANQDLFRRRARYFLTDNHRSKVLHVRVGTATIPSEKSTANGHFHGLARVTPATPPPAWVDSAVVMPAGDARHFHGTVQFPAALGWSVVSDIDDTIKLSNVLDKKELMANTFLREFRAVPGMASAYHDWAESGAVFHYVSASPWQLYPVLTEFLQDAGFPRGELQMRQFRFKDHTFFNLFQSPEVSKPPVIETILRHYPQRHFVLVGDAGEKDPEIYGALARTHPAQIAHIFIRLVGDNPPDHARFAATFAGLADTCWTLINDGGQLPAMEHVVDCAKPNATENNGTP